MGRRERGRVGPASDDGEDELERKRLAVVGTRPQATAWRHWAAPSLVLIAVLAAGAWALRGQGGEGGPATADPGPAIGTGAERWSPTARTIGSPVPGGSAASVGAGPGAGASEATTASPTAPPAPSNASQPRPLRRAVIRITGMTCGGCAAGIERELSGTAGVADARASFQSGSAVVLYDPQVTTAEQLAFAVNGLGDRYRASVAEDGPA